MKASFSLIVLLLSGFFFCCQHASNPVKVVSDSYSLSMDETTAELEDCPEPDPEPEPEPDPEPEPIGPCVGSPGYWKNHSETWPEGSIWIGVELSGEEALEILTTPTKARKEITLAKSLIAARLNELSGNDITCVEEELTALREWYADHLTGEPVGSNTAAWEEVEPLYLLLDAYNNGELCAPGCDPS